MHSIKDMETTKMPHYKRMDSENVVFMHNGIFTKKNEILSFVGKRMELKNIVLIDVSQAQKVKNHMFFLICRL
jgi:hypothetical protein